MPGFTDEDLHQFFRMMNDGRGSRLVLLPPPMDLVVRPSDETRGITRLFQRARRAIFSWKRLVPAALARRSATLVSRPALPPPRQLLLAAPEQEHSPDSETSRSIPGA